MTKSITNRRRLKFIGLAIVIFITGVASRTIPSASILISKYLGDALYAVMFYASLSIVFPNASVRFRGLTTVLFVTTVECFQLTGIPLEMRQNGSMVPKLLSIALGTTFSFYDMLAYAAGIGCVTLCESKTRLLE